jgi:hypothetical protein
VNIPENVNWNELCMEFCKLSPDGWCQQSQENGKKFRALKIRRKLVLPTVEFPCLLRLYGLN